MIHGFVLLGAILGAAGTALDAAAAHAPAFAGLQHVAMLMILHGVALVSLGLHGQGNRPIKLGGVALAMGIGLFALELTFYTLKAKHLLPYAAPIGGSLMIAGWLLVALGAFGWRR